MTGLRNALGGYLENEDRKQVASSRDVQMMSGLMSMIRQQQEAQRAAQMAPLQMEALRAQVQERQLAAQMAQRKREFFTSENMQKYMTAGQPAVAPGQGVTGGMDEGGLGQILGVGPTEQGAPAAQPAQAPRLDVDSVIAGAVSQGVLNPEAMINRQAQIDQRMADREARRQDMEMRFAQENRTLAERQAFQAQQARERASDREYMLRVAASLRPAPQPKQDPLVQVEVPDPNNPGQKTLRYVPQSQAAGMAAPSSGSQNKPPAGFRWTPDGNLQVIPGGPADVRAQALAQRSADGATDVDITLSQLRDAYGRLEKGGGITSTEQGPLSNLRASASSSAVGQVAGKAFGTSNQSARNEIAMARPALLSAIMKATGMSARQMDSNAELKLWLQTATDPTLDVEANRQALDNIEKRFLRRSPAAPRIANDADRNALPSGAQYIAPDGKVRTKR